MWGVLLTVSVGWGQSAPTDPDYEPTELNADPFRPSLDPGGLWVTESVELPAPFVARADVWRSRNLLTWTPADSDGDPLALVGDTVTLHLAGAHRLGNRLRLGLSAPLHLLLGSDTFDTPAPVAGDLATSAKVRFSNTFGGLAVFTVPLGGRLFQLGAPSVSLDLGVIASARVSALTFLFNGGLRLQEEAILSNIDEDLVYGSGIWYRGGVGWSPTSSWQWTAEAQGVFFGETLFEQPLEALVGGTHQNKRGRTLRFGVGVGLRGGVGTPTWRALAGIGHQPDFQ